MTVRVGFERAGEGGFFVDGELSMLSPELARNPERHIIGEDDFMDVKVLCRLIAFVLGTAFCLAIINGCSYSVSPLAKEKCQHLNSLHDNYKCNAVWDKVALHDDIDFVQGSFRVVTSGGVTGVEAANIPVDAIKYGMTDFFKVSKTYKYMDRIIAATQKGLATKGKAAVFISYSKNDYLNYSVYYQRNQKQLMFVSEDGLFDKKLYTVDLTDVDVTLR